MQQKMSDVSIERWKLAQSHEKKVWESIGEEWLIKHSKNYLKKAEKITEIAEKNFKSLKNLRILQIGCGPRDIINEIKSCEKHSIDPLADFYKKKFNFNYDETNLIEGVGENLPYKDNFFDIIIFANVLDHTNNPGKVLSEIKRVLKSKGFVWLEAHFYQKDFIRLSKIYGFFKKTITGRIFNPCHPYMFQLYELKNMILQDFSTQDERIGEDIEKNFKDLKDIKNAMKKEKFTRKLPAVFGLLGIINYSCLCRKKEI
ncbi:MAG TPA: methyltransferase domain-containing protein [Candidatus Nanoarchaeia archaeon]|nr:methyltransferase domain-containing protein [Candidatus Nanoarchaeia archaeon]